MSAVVVDNLDVSYGRTKITHGISFAVAEGESFALVGESGSGKTTVLKAIAGLAPEWSGRVTAFGKRFRCPQLDPVRKFADHQGGEFESAQFHPVRKFGDTKAKYRLVEKVVQTCRRDHRNDSRLPEPAVECGQNNKDEV